MDRYIVISSDCHAGLPPEQYRGYLDPQYRELFDQSLPVQIAQIKKVEKTMLVQEINEQWRKGIEQALTGAWDYAERVKMLDDEGIAAEVLFPDGITEMNTPPFGAGLSLPTEGIDPTLQWAGARAHNRWLAELCQTNPDRHLGVAVIPLLWDIEEGVKEVRWAVKNGLRAVMIPHIVGKFDCYNDPRYYPFWAVCQELDVIVNFHSGAAPFNNFFGNQWPDKQPNPGAVGAYTTEVFFWTWRPLTFLIWGGVFERYPRLKVAIAETGNGWQVAPYLQTLDFNYHEKAGSAKLGDFRSHLKMAPSEYFRRNVGIGASCISRPDVDARYAIGIDQIMWGSDYPHPEGSWPQTAQQMFDAFKDVPEAEIAAMLGENAVKFYGFDRSKLAAIASGIGPARNAFASAA